LERAGKIGSARILEKRLGPTAEPAQQTEHDALLELTRTLNAPQRRRFPRAACPDLM